MIHDLIMPKMGESISEATILRWLLKEGDEVNVDQAILEIATDKVDSEITSPVQGKITQILFKENDVVPVDAVIAYISTQGEQPIHTDQYQIEEGFIEDTFAPPEEDMHPVPDEEIVPFVPVPPFHGKEESGSSIKGNDSKDRFYSPLVRTIAKEENISIAELQGISGTGSEGRVTKSDVLHYLEQKQKALATVPSTKAEPQAPLMPKSSPSIQGDIEIIEMDRMGRLISDHMVNSKQTSPHVTSFIEVDVTNIVKWREKNKAAFQEKYKQNITYTPIFLEAVIQAIKAYPLINASVNNYQITLKKDINIGMATALTSGNLIVPVIKKADLLNLQGLANAVNDLASRARLNQLKPDEVMGGTFTVTNIGSFDSLMGTPIINQPQVAILAIGSIKKKPIVIESSHGDVIGIGHCMFMSLSYDHRIINGFLGGSFLKKMADLLESFDLNTNF